MKHEDDRLAWRAAVHRALGEPHRLRVVDALRVTDLTPSELGEVAQVPSNLLAFHLDVLEEAGLIARTPSQGDGRRRYVSLQWDTLAAAEPSAHVTPGLVLFVCTHNAARSQFAAALWAHRTGRPALSAGTRPAAQVEPLAVEVGRLHGVDLSGAAPRGYTDVDADVDLVVSVCDRAREAGIPWRAQHLHWSVPDPVGHGRRAFEHAFADIRHRIDRLEAAARSAA